jgi:hypothetical protein
MLVAAVAVPNAARSQTPTERAVRAVVDSFFDAIRQEKWESAAGFVEIARFETYFKQVVGNARSALPQPDMTAEQLMAQDSTMPRAVAEWQVAQWKKYGGTRPAFGDMSHEFAGVHSQQDLFALKLPEAVARWLEAQDERTQMRNSWRLMGCPLADLPSFPGAKRFVLAVAIANDSAAYVVHSDDRFAGAPQDMSFYSDTERLMRLHRSGGAWRIELRPDLLRPMNMGFSMGECPKPKKKP